MWPVLQIIQADFLLSSTLLYTYIPNSIKVALAIRHWAFGHTEHKAMSSLSDHRTIASQCAIAQCPKQPLLN